MCSGKLDRGGREQGQERDRAISPFFRFSFRIASFWYIYSMMVIFFELHIICLRWQCKRTNIVSFPSNEISLDQWIYLGLNTLWMFGRPRFWRNFIRMCWYLVRKFNAPFLRHFILMFYVYIWIRSYDCIFNAYVCVCATIAYTHYSQLVAYCKKKKYLRRGSLEICPIKKRVIFSGAGFAGWLRNLW